VSGEDLAQKVAGLLKTDVAKAAEGAVDLRMKDLPGIVHKEMEGLPGIVRKEMDACLDGKCDAIADRLIAKLPKTETPALSGEDVTKAVKEAMERSKTPFTVEGHTAHDILDCPTCKPIVIDTLWESKEYRQAMAEKVCEDEECRNLFLKQFEEKGYGVKENGGKEESWADRRLRERRERNTD
jgi:hypothetical protein